MYLQKGQFPQLMKKIFFSERSRLIDAIDQILAGNLEQVDVGKFRNKKYIEKINQLIEYSKSRNNPTVMRLNSAMGALGDNSMIKQTFDQVGIQSGILSGMEESHQSMETSIGDISANMGNIRENTKNLLAYSEQIVGTMTDNIEGVHASTMELTRIDRDLQEFRKNIATIHKIVDSVQNIARESNILALNASIEAGRAGEAGKGFAVIADNMRALTVDIQESSEEIGEYVAEIATTVESIAKSMNDTTQILTRENATTEQSLGDMNQMNEQLHDIQERLDAVFTAIDLQTTATYAFAKQMKELSISNQALTDDCLGLGRHMFKIGRYNDKTRSDMLKNNANVSTRDWLTIFEVDHYVLTWRVYNNIVGFEQLKSSQVDNPAGCKLGKWITSNASAKIGRLDEFLEVRRAHERLHTYATESFNAKATGDDKLAIAAFEKTLSEFYVFQDSIRKLNEKLMAQGDDIVTEYVAF